MTEQEKNELVNKQEYKTYLDGLRDALVMTKSQAKKAIEFLENDNSWMEL